MSGSQRSLGKGSDAMGPVPEGVIRLYSMRFCPYAQRVRIALIAKGIKHEIVNINTKNKPDWFFEKSPLGLVPALEMSDGNIMMTAVLYKILFARKNNENTTELKAQFAEKFTELEERFAQLKTPYFSGKSVSMIDYMIWTWFERFNIFDVKEYLEKTPHINAWINLMLQDPAVKATFTEPDVLTAFFNLYSQDNLEAVDYGLDSFYKKI